MGLHTALEHTNLLGDILRNRSKQDSERADTGFRAPAFTSSAVSRDQHAPYPTTSTVEYLIRTVQDLITLAVRGVIPPADLRDADSSPVQGTPLAQPHSIVAANWWVLMFHSSTLVPTRRC